MGRTANWPDQHTLTLIVPTPCGFLMWVSLEREKPP